MKDRIGTELKYVKANVVHRIGDKESALKCLGTCGDKFLLRMIALFRDLKYVIVYDFDDGNAKDPDAFFPRGCEKCEYTRLLYLCIHSSHRNRYD